MYKGEPNQGMRCIIDVVNRFSPVVSFEIFDVRVKCELPDIKEVREKTGLSQMEFAARLHISARTLQNWEQGRRYPTGPAATLIRILDAHPSLI